MISVVIIAKNESERIETCIKSVLWADEVVVVDNDSTDNTKEVAKKHTDKVYTIKSNNFSEIRNFALDKVRGEWLLFVDADERVTKILKDEILGLINSETKDTAWKISRRNIILGEEKRYKAFWPDYVIRLFKRDKLREYTGEVHEQPQFEGSLGTLKNSLIHLTHRDIDSMVLKSLDWANIDANLRFKTNHPKMNGPRFVKIVTTEMYNQLVKRGGLKGGTVGVIDALLQTFSLYITYVKLWQLQRKETLDETYEKIDKKLVEDGFEY